MNSSTDKQSHFPSQPFNRRKKNSKNHNLMPDQTLNPLQKLSSRAQEPQNVFRQQVSELFSQLSQVKKKKKTNKTQIIYRRLRLVVWLSIHTCTFLFRRWKGTREGSILPIHRHQHQYTHSAFFCLVYRLLRAHQISSLQKSLPASSPFVVQD